MYKKSLYAQNLLAFSSDEESGDESVVEIQKDRYVRAVQKKHIAKVRKTAPSSAMMELVSSEKLAHHKLKIAQGRQREADLTAKLDRANRKYLRCSQLRDIEIQAREAAQKKNQEMKSEVKKAKNLARRTQEEHESTKRRRQEAERDLLASRQRERDAREEKAQITTCKICQNHPTDYALVCGHLVCNRCSLKIIAGTEIRNECPYCRRRPINDRHRIFFS